MKNSKQQKYSVCILIINKENPKLYLGVSRKDNFDDFGLVGGRCEPNETLEQAAVRETKEETGLDISNLKPIFSDFVRENKIYYCTTFIANYSGTINTQEEGVVKWVTMQELLDGSFSDYNRRLFESLNIAS